MEDVGGEIIDRSPMVAMSLLWPAISIWVGNRYRGMQKKRKEDVIIALEIVGDTRERV